MPPKRTRGVRFDPATYQRDRTPLFHVEDETVRNMKLAIEASFEHYPLLEVTLFFDRRSYTKAQEVARVTTIFQTMAVREAGTMCGRWSVCTPLLSFVVLAMLHTRGSLHPHLVPAQASWVAAATEKFLNGLRFSQEPDHIQHITVPATEVLSIRKKITRLWKYMCAPVQAHSTYTTGHRIGKKRSEAGTKRQRDEQQEAARPVVPQGLETVEMNEALKEDLARLHVHVDTLLGYYTELKQAKPRSNGRNALPTFTRFVGVVLILKLNVAFDQAPVIIKRFGLENLDERSWRRALADFGSAIYGWNSPDGRWFQGVEVQRRFDAVDKTLPNVTALAGGTPVPCRPLGDSCTTESGKQSKENYNSKCTCWKFEVWTTMLGVPLSFRGPKAGKDHDMKFMEVDVMPFPHVKEEYWLGGSGYPGADHCLLPFKTPENDEKQKIGDVVMSVGSDGEEDIEIVHLADEGDTVLPVTTRDYWNTVHARFRVRIEGEFSHLLTWKWTELCRLDEIAARHAMAITIGVSAYEGFRRRSPYPDFKPADKSDYTYTLCRCAKEDDALLTAAKQKRTQLCDSFAEQGYVPTSRPASHAKAGTPTKIQAEGVAEEVRQREAALRPQQK